MYGNGVYGGDVCDCGIDVDGVDDADIHGEHVYATYGDMVSNVNTVTLLIMWMFILLVLRVL